MVFVFDLGLPSHICHAILKRMGLLYINLLELYCLDALNICRYWLIVRNQNVYIVYRRKLILISIIIPLLIFFNLCVQAAFDWCVVTREAGASCSVSYTNNVVRIWNLVVVTIVPILISFLFVSSNFIFSKKTLIINKCFIRRNHHHRLIIHSSIFYSIWLILWLPFMIVTFLDIDSLNGSVAFVTVVASSMEIMADPIISIFLDKRLSLKRGKDLSYGSNRKQIS